MPICSSAWRDSPTLDWMERDTRALDENAAVIHSSERISSSDRMVSSSDAHTTWSARKPARATKPSTAAAMTADASSQPMPRIAPVKSAVSDT